MTRVGRRTWRRIGWIRRLRSFQSSSPVRWGVKACVYGGQCVGEWKSTPMSNESVPESNSTSETPSTNEGPIEIPVGDGMAEFTSAPAAESTTAEEAARPSASPVAEEAPTEEQAEPIEDFANILKEFERG